MQFIGNNNSDLTEMNRSVLIKILQRRKICSRADIAKEMGLTQASITKIVAVLMEMGIVSEVGSIKGAGNRRSIGLKLNAEKYKVIGVKFARHTYAVGLFDISGRLYEQKEYAYSILEDKKRVLNGIKVKIQSMIEKFPDIVAVGLALPGPYLRNEGKIAVMTQMVTWHDVNFKKEFEHAFGRPCFIEHDANAGAVAEWWFGGHTDDMNTLAYFLVGEGVGSGIVENGNLILGKQGTASEIGHTSIDFKGPRCECGNYGCLELYCSTQAVLDLAKKEKLFEKDITNRIEAYNTVFAMANAKDEKALKVVRRIANYIAYGCLGLISSYNPGIIVIGDLVSVGGDLLLDCILEVVKERMIPELYERLEIKLSKLDIDSTLYGAAAIATDKILRNPSAYLVMK